MKNLRRRYARLFVVAVACFAANAGTIHAQSQVGQIVPSRPNPDRGPSISDSPPASVTGSSKDQDELARRLHQAGLKQGLLNSPYLYRALADVMSAPNERTISEAQRSLAERKLAEERARNAGTLALEIGTPLSGITGGSLKGSVDIASKEKAQHALLEDRAREREQLLTEISTPQGNARFNEITRYVTDLLYDRKQGKALTQDQNNILDFYNKTVKREEVSIPRNPGDAATLLNGSQDVGNLLTKAGYTTSEVRDVMNGRKTLEQINNPKAK